MRNLKIMMLMAVAMCFLYQPAFSGDGLGVDPPEYDLVEISQSLEENSFDIVSINVVHQEVIAGYVYSMGTISNGDSFTVISVIDQGDAIQTSNNTADVSNRGGPGTLDIYNFDPDLSYTFGLDPIKQCIRTVAE